jgi:hypothetical protein
MLCARGRHVEEGVVHVRDLVELMTWREGRGGGKAWREGERGGRLWKEGPDGGAFMSIGLNLRW